MSDPVFDPDSAHAVIVGDPHGRAFMQGSAYFRADGTYWTDAAQPEDDVWILCRRRNGTGPLELVSESKFKTDIGAFSGAYNDLTGKPTLGTAAATAATAYATAAQGTKADAAAPQTLAGINALLNLLPTSDPADGVSWWMNGGVLTKASGP